MWPRGPHIPIPCESILDSSTSFCHCDRHHRHYQGRLLANVLKVCFGVVRVKIVLDHETGLDVLGVKILIHVRLAGELAFLVEFPRAHRFQGCCGPTMFASAYCSVCYPRTWQCSVVTPQAVGPAVLEDVRDRLSDAFDKIEDATSICCEQTLKSVLATYGEGYVLLSAIVTTLKARMCFTHVMSDPHRSNWRCSNSYMPF